jgi:Rod binding domain-containing protein
MATDSVGAATSITPLGPMPSDPKTRLKKAATDMEAVWLAQVLREARPKGGMLDKSFAAQTFQDMFSETLAQSMADSKAIGLSDMLVRQLEPKVSASPALPASGGINAAR